MEIIIIEILADDIYHAYLNGLNTRILIHEYGSYQQCPDELHVRVEAIESFFMTEVSYSNKEIWNRNFC
jgi:hypothetical protein